MNLWYNMHRYKGLRKRPLVTSIFDIGGKALLSEYCRHQINVRKRIFCFGRKPLIFSHEAKDVATQACTPWVDCAHAILCTCLACPFLVFHDGLLAVTLPRYLERGTLLFAAKGLADSPQSGAERLG